MKQSQVKPGVRAMLSLGGRRGAVAVTVRFQWTGLSAMIHGSRHWCVVDSSGTERTVTARQLQPMPAPVPLGAHERAAFLRMSAGRPGQTIDAGDVVITTTLHRLG
jgi:hypothetical protein